MTEVDNIVRKFQSDEKPRYEAMLFQYQTTTLTDYRLGENTPLPPKTVYKPRRTPERKPYEPIKHLETMSEYLHRVPFSLYMRPKEILHTDPRHKQKYFEKPKDEERAMVQQTRPRLVMTPAVSLDDIDNPTDRKILCEDIYTSTATAGTREAIRPYSRVEAPFPENSAKAKPVLLPKYNQPTVSEEWRMDSVEWDNRQHRCFCDLTKEFWLSYSLFPCRACNESAIIEATRKAERQQLKQ
ncbi:uncharacterized protein LOC128676104 [Plodia interpunctella]|uniref:uncharacterized protein LOC128676104 n=1 Tax=Plodia interpunctella TaxID=58824 RepID=UPI0023674DA8|nr:uncharacterized protein LOC128676104 [Plodia interpunctella]